MHWELWDVETGNLIGTSETEAEGLTLVRELVGKGWPAAALSLIAEDEARPVEALPPALTGTALLHRAETANIPPKRRTA